MRTMKLFFPTDFILIKSTWGEAWKSAVFRFKVVITLVVLIFIAILMSTFLSYIESRSGFTINDGILNRVSPRNFSLSIFLLIYSVIILAMVNLISNPFLLLRGLQAYGLLLLMRIACLYLIPLEPEKFIIPLDDPILGYFFYKGVFVTKDLFFSGHISTMSLLFFVIPSRFLKYFFLTATLLVASFIIIQHVHYTIDVIAAPLFSWISYKLAGRLSPEEIK